MTEKDYTLYIIHFILQISFGLFSFRNLQKFFSKLINYNNKHSTNLISLINHHNFTN